MPFADRRTAGIQLAEALSTYRDQHPVILALPRGGVSVAAEVARSLGAPMDLVIARKIGVPMQPELAMGAVVDGETPIVVRNEDVIATAGVSEPEFQRICRDEFAEIGRRRKRYLGDREPMDIAGRLVIVIDDGIATGATIRAALRATRLRRPRHLVLSIPVAPSESIHDLADEADEIVCLESYDSFGAIGAYYGDFRQVTDEEVIALMAAATPFARETRG